MRPGPSDSSVNPSSLHQGFDVVLGLCRCVELPSIVDHDDRVCLIKVCFCCSICFLVFRDCLPCRILVHCFGGFPQGESAIKLLSFNEFDLIVFALLLVG